MNKKRLYNLLEKYLNDRCSEEEMKELLEQFKRAENEPEIKHYLDTYWKNLSGDKAGAYADLIEDSEHWFDEIYSKARQKEEQSDLYRKRAYYRQAGHRTYSQWMKIAAILVVGGLLSLFVFTMVTDMSPEEVVVEQKVSGAGEKMRFTLPDGTQVHLNSESSLEYSIPFSARNRTVRLTGEAYFVVTRDEARPFLVETDDVTTRVLGTSFNIRSYPEDEEVTVAVSSGVVSVSSEQVSQEEGGVILEANEWVQYASGTGKFDRGSGDISALTAWNEGVLLYHDKKLEEVAVQLERWYGVTIEFENESIKQCIIRGEHRDETLVNVLNAITYAFEMEYEIREGKDVLLKGSGCD